MSEQSARTSNFAEYKHELRESLSIFRWVWDELIGAEAKRWMFRMYAVLFIMTLAFVLQPLAFSWMVNAIQDRESALLLTAGAALVALALVRHGTALAQNLMREWTWNRSIFRMHTRVNELFHQKSLGQHTEEGSRLNYPNIEKGRARVETVQQMLLFETGSMLISIVFSYALLWFISWEAALAMTGLIVVYLVWSFYLNYHVAVDTTPIEKNFRACNRETVERWEKVARVRTSGKSASEYRRLSGWLDRTLYDDWRFWAWFIKHSEGRDLVGFVVRMLFIGYGVYLVWIGEQEVGFLIPLFTWVTNITQDLWFIGHAQRRLNEQVPYIKALREAITIPPTFSADTGEIITNTQPIGVRFCNVSLTFPSRDAGDFVLRDLSFAIQPGDKLALLGPSGAGKTSAMKLLLRYMDPSAGEIWVNGHRLTDVQLDSWMEHVGYIAQQPQIFDATLRYNLTFGLSAERQASITDDEIWAVMRQLQIDFGKSLVHGLDTLVGKDGMKLSGGEAQRLMIGAAVIKRPIFMVIDEATSAPDSSTERLVQSGLQQALTDEVGALIVAHRLSTVRNVCNRFLVLRSTNDLEPCEPQLEAQANSFEELYAISPTFRALADDQGVVI